MTHPSSTLLKPLLARHWRDAELCKKAHDLIERDGTTQAEVEKAVAALHSRAEDVQAFVDASFGEVIDWCA
jgi:hypothetical protein